MKNDNIGNSLSWRSWCYFEAQVWKKDSNIVPSLFFSHFLVGFFVLFFLFGLLWPLLLFIKSGVSWGNHSLHHPFLTWDNALIMKIITLLFIYNSRITSQYIEQNMTLCECLRRCIGICNESRVTCMKELWTVALPQIRCQLHDHAKRNMTMMKRVIINGTVESCMAIYVRMTMKML